MTKQPTLVAYIRTGAYVRLFNQILVDTIVNVGRVFPQKETARLVAFEQNIVVPFKDMAEKRMLKDYPDAKHEQLKHVFYGTPYTPPRDDVDLEVQGIIIDVLEKMLDKAKAARELALNGRHR
ncbi:MAG: hypothetical protein IJT41_11970 [Clostridia bacterium]|nr:hypothetical protein [Clostridia bacterium]